MNFDQAYAQLNPEQKAAVDQIEGPVMVLAGPGTGKTQIIALRIAQILKSTQAAPYNILCLTFTESGVAAMRKRLLECIGETAYGVRIHTFHSFCNEVIQEFPTEFLFARELAALTDLERIQLLHELLDELPENAPLRPFTSPYFYLKEITRALQTLKREHIVPEAFQETTTQMESVLQKLAPTVESFIKTHARELKEEDFLALKSTLEGTPFLAYLDKDCSESKQRTLMKNALKDAWEEAQRELPKQKQLAQLYEAYQNKLRQKGRYDFEDMIHFVIEKLKGNDALRAHYQEQFQYILVDEYQDTNGAQNEVVLLLGAYFEIPNIFVVGDDKQSIYRFQGASVENLLTFYKLYKNCVQVVSLRENYRSQQMLLSAAYSVIQKNQQSLAHFLEEDSEVLHANVDYPEQKVHLAELDTPQSEHYFVAKAIQTLINNGSKPSEIAVLYRNNREAEDLIELFLRMDLPFHLWGGQDLLQDKSIQKLLDLLRVIAHLGEEEEQLYKILHYDFWSFDGLELAKLGHSAHTKRKSLLELMKENPVFESCADQLFAWHKDSLQLPLVECFDHVIKESGYLERLLQKEKKVEELNRLNSLFMELKKWNQGDPTRTLADFLEYVDLLRENQLTLPTQELSTQKEAVQLMTAHRSKGLEFEHVFLINLVDHHWGNAPDRSKIKWPLSLSKMPLAHEPNEEERRLFFVALTRAKKTLTLSYAKQNAQGRATVPSMFLQEMDASSIEKINTEPLEQEALPYFQTLFLSPKPSLSQDHKNYVRGLLKNYTLSVTHLNNYLRCPRLFYYNNVLRVPRAKSKYQAFGTAIHESLKDLLLSVREGDRLDKPSLMQQFETHLKREFLSQQEFRGGLELGKSTLEDYYDAHSDTFHPNVLLEYDFRPHGVQVNGVPITGKLDKIELKDEVDRTVHVVDYKTGNPDSKSAEFGPQGEYRRQILFYKLLCDESKKFPYTMVSGAIDFVQKNKAGGFTQKTIYPEAEELEALKTQIKAVYEDILNLRFLELDDFESCGECEWCLTLSAA